MSAWLIFLIAYFGINIVMAVDLAVDYEPWWIVLLALFFGVPILLFILGIFIKEGWWRK